MPFRWRSCSDYGVWERLFDLRVLIHDINGKDRIDWESLYVKGYIARFWRLFIENIGHLQSTYALKELFALLDITLCVRPGLTTS